MWKWYVPDKIADFGPEISLAVTVNDTESSKISVTLVVRRA